MQLGYYNEPDMRNGKAAKTPNGEDGFATRLRELHKQHGLSRPAADTLKRLADALDVFGDYLLEGAVEEAAQARFEDSELLRQFQEVEKLPDEDKDVIKRLLDAFLTKKRLQELAAR